MKRGFVVFLFFFFGVFLIFAGYKDADANGKRIVTVQWSVLSDSIIAYNLDETVAQGDKCRAFTKTSQSKPILAEKFLKVKGIMRVCICPEFNVTIDKGEAFDTDVINFQAEKIFEDFFPGAAVEMKCKKTRN